MIEDVGECKLPGDSANIPVDIWINKVSEEPDENDDGDEDHVGEWKLSASNYMPRKARVSAGAYLVYATTREELAALVKKHIIPLYEVALSVLNEMVSADQECLYYWERSD